MPAHPECKGPGGIRPLALSSKVGHHGQAAPAPSRPRFPCSADWQPSRASVPSPCRHLGCQWAPLSTPSVPAARGGSMLGGAGSGRPSGQCGGSGEAGAGVVDCAGQLVVLGGGRGRRDEEGRDGGPPAQRCPSKRVWCRPADCWPPLRQPGHSTFLVLTTWRAQAGPWAQRRSDFFISFHCCSFCFHPFPGSWHLYLWTPIRGLKKRKMTKKKYKKEKRKKQKAN